jgi:hypothetical protein
MKILITAGIAFVAGFLLSGYFLKPPLSVTHVPGLSISKLDNELRINGGMSDSGGDATVFVLECDLVNKKCTEWSSFISRKGMKGVWAALDPQTYEIISQNEDRLVIRRDGIGKNFFYTVDLNLNSLIYSEETPSSQLVWSTEIRAGDPYILMNKRQIFAQLFGLI